MATATTTAPKVRRHRTPSAFRPTARITVNVHSDLDVADTAKTFAELLATDFPMYATRVVARERHPRKSRKTGATVTPTGPASATLYIAPEGYTFKSAPANRGVRLDADTANALRAIAAQLGLDPTDPAAINAVAKKLVEKMAK